jgi:hypothetical protein
MSSCESIPAPGSSDFAPDEIIIYGVNVKGSGSGTGKGDILVKPNWKVTLTPSSVPPGTDFQIVAAYGYAYEGHCYRFDRPRILMFSSREIGPNPGADAAGCGFDVSKEYKMWRVPSDKEVMELTAQIDTFRTLVLEANLPGRRPPNTYASEMMLAHRGGRLTGAGS